MRMRLSQALLLAVLLVDACGASESPSDPLAGHWRGSGHDSSTEITLDFELTQNGSSVSGDAMLQFVGQAGDTTTYYPTVSGTYSSSHAQLTLAEPGFQSATYAGPVTSDSTFPGSLTGSGFTGVTVPVTRQH